MNRSTPALISIEAVLWRRSCQRTCSIFAAFLATQKESISRLYEIVSGKRRKYTCANNGTGTTRGFPVFEWSTVKDVDVIVSVDIANSSDALKPVYDAIIIAAFVASSGAAFASVFT